MPRPHHWMTPHDRMATPHSPQALDLLARAGKAYGAGAMKLALELCEQLARIDPGNAEAHYLAGLAANASQDTAVAIRHLDQAVQLEPRRTDYIVQLARALSEDSQTERALQMANQALCQLPRDAIMLDNLGNVFLKANAYEKAREVFTQAVQRAPGNALCHFNLAMTLMFTHDLPGAGRELERCLQLRPDLWRAYTMRSQLRRQTLEHNHVEQLEALLGKHAHSLEAVYFLNMALGKEYEDLRSHAKAFDHYTSGKTAIRRRMSYDPEAMETLVGALIESFPGTPATGGHASDQPIFIVGMPRSGTTLVERILSSHPDVRSAGELDLFPRLVRQLAGAAHDAILDRDLVQRALQLDPQALGEAYLRGARPMFAGAPRFTDKLPHNFLYLGLIARALPRARFICLRRDPVDTCLSNYREAFDPGAATHHYSFDLMETGRYYLQFDRLMSHWRRHLPGRLLEIDYETIVESQEDATRLLLNHCGLSWNENCLHFERNPAATATASAVQVRSPIYANAVRRWQHYEVQTRPLRRLLGLAMPDNGH